VTAEVETSHAAYLNSQIVVDASLAQVQSARASVAAATRGFAVGTSDATTLLQVLGNLRGAVEAYCRALQKHNQSVAAHYRFSARWPEAAPPLVQERLSNLQMSGPPQSPPGR
jgi:outer membrane protein TolC